MQAGRVRVKPGDDAAALDDASNEAAQLLMALLVRSQGAAETKLNGRCGRRVGEHNNALPTPSLPDTTMDGGSKIER